MDTNTTTDKNIVITREFEATPEQVWKCWTEPKHLRAWYAQADFDLPVCEVDLRIGGRMFMCVHGHDDKGNDWKVYCGGNYVEIVPHQRLVMSGFFADEAGTEVPASHYGATVWPDEVELIVELEPNNGGTRMTYKETLLPVPLQDKWMGERFDKLAAHLGEMA
jgi:uncharacterized protein YndB with AHSA1/START domain